MKLLLRTLMSMVLLYSLDTYATERLPDYFKLIPSPQKIELLSAKEGISYNSLREIHLQGRSVRPVLYESLESLPLTNKSFYMSH